MKVMFLIPSLASGGSERQLVVLANGLAARGHAVSVAVFYSGGAMEKDLSGVRLVPLNKQGRWDLPGFGARLVSTVRRERPDMVYTFLGSANIFGCLLKPLFGGAKVVCSLRASDMDLSRYDSAARVAGWLEVRLSGLADAIIANSRAGREHAIRRGMPEGSILVIENGIDTARYVPDREAGADLRRSWGVDPGEVLVGLVARIDPMKGHETFIQAAAVVSRREKGVRFVCVGGGESVRAGRLRAMAEGLGLAGRLTWAGELDYMPSVYNALNISCLSSLTEGFPNAVGEAMSAGVPCVATDVGDVARIVGPTGIVVPREDAGALAEAMLEMIARVRAGEAGDPRQRIVDNFPLETMIIKTEQALQSQLP